MTDPRDEHPRQNEAKSMCFMDWMVNRILDGGPDFRPEVIAALGIERPSLGDYFAAFISAKDIHAAAEPAAVEPAAPAPPAATATILPFRARVS